MALRDLEYYTFSYIKQYEKIKEKYPERKGLSGNEYLSYYGIESNNQCQRCKYENLREEIDMDEEAIIKKIQERMKIDAVKSRKYYNMFNE